MVHHFAHASGKECPHAVETALHRMGKEAIHDAVAFALPAVYVPFVSYREAWMLAAAQTVQVDDARLESRLGGIVPDVFLSVQGHELLVEIKVSHALDAQKLGRIAGLGVFVIEVSIDVHQPRARHVGHRGGYLSTHRSPSRVHSSGLR